MITIESVRRRADLDAQSHGYRLNPDPEMLTPLLEGLKVNEERYGYPACPCRPCAGDFELDRDIICPCDYRDPDVMEFGMCYCCLYVEEATHESGETHPIPERRPAKKQSRAFMGVGFAEPEKEETEDVAETEVTGRRLLYCKVCGYVSFREEPPYVCPICRAKREMFAEVGTDVLKSSS